MKKSLLFLLMIMISCMNTKQEKSKNNNLPEDFFSGKDLEMGKAIHSGDSEKIGRLLQDEKYNPNSRGNVKSEGRLQRWTYLGYSILVGEIKSSEKLLQLGADVNIVSLDGAGVVTNIGQACSLKNSEMIELLLKYKVNLNPPLSGSPLHELLISDAPKHMLELLISKGADINHQDYISGDTVSITALGLGKFDLVNYFLDKGADPFVTDSSGNSLVSLVQNEIEEGRLNDFGLKEYTKLKDRLINEFYVKFPVKDEFRKGREQRISRYESLSLENKELLGEAELKRVESFKEGLAQMDSMK